MGGGQFFRLTCSVVLWEGRKAANKYHWCVWGMLPVSRAHWVCPAHEVCAFPVYTAQALGCSAGNCLRRALGCMHFPGLSRSGSGTRVLLKGSDLVGPAFCALPRSEPLRWPGVWQAWLLLLIASPVPASRFSGFTTSAPSQVDVDRPESQDVLVSNEAYLHFGRWCLSGAVIAPFWLWLP